MTTANARSIANFVNIKNLKDAKAIGGKYPRIDEAGGYLVQIEGCKFDFKQTPSGNPGAAYLAIENKILTSKSTAPHLQPGEKVSMLAIDEGNSAKVYSQKIKNAIEALLGMSPAEIKAMSEAEFIAVSDGLFFDKMDARGNIVQAAQAVGEILYIHAVDAKNQSKEDRVYTSYAVATDDQLAAGGYRRNAKGGVDKIPLAQ